MPTKAYFIGLGGCGLKTVSDLQKRLCPTGDFSEYQFTYVDTDDETVKKINTDQVIIRPGDLVNIGDTNPYQVYNSALGGSTQREKRMTEWVIPQGGNGAARFTLPNNFLCDGARGQRMIGRTGFYYRYDDIESEIRAKLSTFAEFDKEASHNQIPQIWVVASSCGGTGSSMTLDVLYLIHKLVNEGWHSDPELRLVLFMPQPFIEANRGNDDYPLNAFSYMWELNAFRLDHQKGTLDRFHHFSVNPDGPTNGTFPLYKYVIPVDVETSFGAKIPLDSLYPTVAEMIYYCNHGAAAQEMMSSLSNDQNTLTQLTEHNSTPFPWTQTLAPYGYRLIKKANDELNEYLAVRARYEVLKFGLLGDNMSDNPDARDSAKKHFGNEYIVKNLCDIDCQDVKIYATERSLQYDIDELYQISFSQNGLDKMRINSYLTQIDELGIEAKKMYKPALERLIKSIDKGVQDCILDYGLRYTKDVLNLVDDFYLETVILPVLKLEKGELQTIKEEKRSECDSLCASYKDKMAAQTCKALGEYRDLCKRYVTLEVAISVIEDGLTPYPIGYLEVLRKGSDRINGMQSVITKLEVAAADAYNDYIALAKRFIDTGKDALTQYLPDLSAMAKGENDSYWAKDSLFDTLYRDAMIASDAEYELKFNERIPERKNEGDNNLRWFIEKIITGENSLVKLLHHNDKLSFERYFLDWVMSPLNSEIAKAATKEGTQAYQWLGHSLYESLNMENMLPEGTTREKFLNSLANKDRIPVLFPTTAGATRPRLTRIMYAGASEALACELGYIPEDNTSNKYIHDASMDDRFLIIKMPMGYDFFSYKYFLEIQKKYVEKRKEIISGAHGCHIHKDFSALDIHHAANTAQLRKNLSIVKDLYTAVFYQEFLNILKSNNKEQYNRLMGVFDIPDISGGNNTFGAVSDPFSAASDPFGSSDPFGAASDPFGSTDPFGGTAGSVGGNPIADPFGQISSDKFVTIEFSKELKNLTIATNKIEKVEYHLSFSEKDETVEISEINSLTNFLRAYTEKDMYGLLQANLHSVYVLKEFIMNDVTLRRSFAEMFMKTREASLNHILFQFAVSWQKLNVELERPYFALIGNILNGRS